MQTIRNGPRHFRNLSHLMLGAAIVVGGGTFLPAEDTGHPENTEPSPADSHVEQQHKNCHDTAADAPAGHSDSWLHCQRPEFRREGDDLRRPKGRDSPGAKMDLPIGLRRGHQW